MAQVLVGLLDFDALQLRSQTGGRLIRIKSAVKKTRDMALQLGIKPEAGKLKSIFIAPEFMFVRAGGHDDGKAVSDDQRKEILAGLDQIALKSPSMLIVPGSIVFKVNTVEAGKKAIGNLANAISPREFNEKITTRKAGGGAYQRPTLPTLDAVGIEPAELYRQQIAKLEEVTKVEAGQLLTQPVMLKNHFLIKNRAYVYFDGKRAFSYGKKNNAGERAGDEDNTIFVPGKKEGVTEIDGFRVGFEICMDHAGGVLLATLNAPNLDLHIICSGWVDNREYVKNICVREGGFCLHASTDSKMTTVLQKKKGFKSTGPGFDIQDEATHPSDSQESRLRREKYRTDQAQYLPGWQPIDPISTVDVGSLSAVRFYLIDLQSPAATIAPVQGAPTGGGLRGAVRGGRGR